MNAKEINSYTYALHADITNSPLFEGIWPIPNGVTLNSYIVQGEKIALIDLYRDWENAPQKMEKQLESINLKVNDIDFLILNHLEPDHTEFLREFHKQNPKAQIIATAKGIALAENFCKAGKANYQAVKTGDTLDLGKGIILSFVEIPNVHWPETMVTYDTKSGVLFSCDAFGSYGKTEDRIFDDEFTQQEHDFFERESLRYYANIVASFSSFVKSAIQKLENITINVVAPSHGLVWRKNPKTIIQRFQKYAGYNTGGKLENKICVVYGSMYGNTKLGVDAVVEGIQQKAKELQAEGKEAPAVCVLEIPSTDISIVLAEAYEAAGIVMAMPTYEYKMFPPAAYMLDLFRRKHFKGKKALRIGSWGWIGGAKKEYDEAVLPLAWDEIEQYEWQGFPSETDITILKERGAMLADAVSKLT
ncbi:MAG: FprA family A-type flavoprotein [Spirochaetaceae bacterium]|nr:FprA family A-type flavoprotein [Spirochaetaceae bacterium]